MSAAAMLITHTHPDAPARRDLGSGRGGGEGRAGRGVQLISHRRTSSTSTATPPPGSSAVEPTASSPDLCLVLGGDGTILYALRRFAGHRRAGVRRQLRHRRLPRRGRARRSSTRACERAFSGDFEVMDAARRSRSTSPVEPPVALNDVSFIRRPHGRVAELSLRDRRTRRSATCAATGWSPPPRPARPATTSPTRARSWPGAWRATWSASSPRTR